jgi:hypothetical protein
MKQDSKPAAILIVIVVMIVLLHQSSADAPWSPPYLGRDLGWSRQGGAESLLLIDTTGLKLPSLSFLPESLPRLEPDELLRVTPGSTKVVKMTWRDHHIPYSHLYAGYPRIQVGQRSDSYRLGAHLHQPEVGKSLFSGPVEGWLSTDVYRPTEPGMELDTLALLPRETERALLLDTRGLHLSKPLRARLMEQWKRWEFEPYISLSEAFGAAFCYAQWEGLDLVVSDIQSREPIDKALDRRFPPNIIELVSTWSHGTPIWGFEKTSRPAWMIRGDHFIATPDGGVDRLDRLLLERYEHDFSFRPVSPLLKELNRLAKSQKGWHVCIIEQRPNSQVHWAALLRWPVADKGKIEGFLVVWLPPDPGPREKKIFDSSIR